MQKREARNPTSAKGDWFIDERCIDCAASREVAPGLRALAFSRRCISRRCMGRSCFSPENLSFFALSAFFLPPILVTCASRMWSYRNV